MTRKPESIPAGKEAPLKSLPVLRVRWQLQFTKCSLTCPYCIARWTQRPVTFDPEVFTRIEERLLSMPYRLVVRLGVEGEAFLSPHILKGIARMSHHPKVEGISFSSNFVVSDDELSAFLDEANTAKLGIGATLHDTQLNDETREAFFRRVETAQKRGVLIFVGYVAIPERFALMRSYKERLDAMGVPFISNEYNGAMEGRPYPEGYSNEERAELKEFLWVDHYYRMLVDRGNPKGNPCLAGYRYLYIGHDGTMYRCGNDRNVQWSLLQRVAVRLNKDWPNAIQSRRVARFRLGNILSETPVLSNVPRKCPHESCTCGNEVQALLDVGEHYHRTRTMRIIYPKNRASDYEAAYPNLAPLENDPC